MISLPALWGQIGNIVVTSAASFQPGVPAKDSIGAIFCTGIRVSGAVTAPGTPLPVSLAGVTVTIAGTDAPLFAVADLGGYQQIDFQTPVDVSGGSLVPSSGTLVPVTVAQNGVQGSATAAVSTGPGDFFQIPGTNFGTFQHSSDYSLVTPDNPAHPGETIVGYATGLPDAVPEVPPGTPAPASPLSYVQQIGSPSGNYMNTIGLVIGNGILLMDTVPPNSFDTAGLLPIPFMGLTPGAVGLYQINFVLPQPLSSGNVSIALVRRFCVGPLPGCDGPLGIQLQGGQPALIPVR